MKPIRVTIHPEDVSEGYEAEAVYCVPKKWVQVIDEGGIRGMNGSNVAVLVLTPKQPSLAQRVKDSGWRCYIQGSYKLIAPQCDNDVWGLYTEDCAVYVANDPLLDSIKLTEADYGGTIRIDKDGYPIVEEETK